MASPDSKQTTTDTLALLEPRLQRLDFALHGHNPHASQPPSQTPTDPKKTPLPPATRLRNLDRTLSALSAQSPTVAALLALQKQHPHLFHAAPQNTTATAAPPPLPAAPLAALLLAHETLYRNLSAQLQQLQSTPVPDPAAATKLVALRGRVEALRQRQEGQARVVAELRGRSAAVVGTWVEEGMLGMGEMWAGWEERLREVEILVRRGEARVRREEEGLV